MEIKKLNYVMLDTFTGSNITHHKCTICTKKLIDLSDNNSSTIVKGYCNHVFHESCMNKRVESGNHTCPIDGQPWSKEWSDSLNKYYKRALIYKNAKLNVFV